MASSSFHSPAAPPRCSFGSPGVVLSALLLFLLVGSYIVSQKNGGPGNGSLVVVRETGGPPCNATAGSGPGGGSSAAGKGASPAVGGSPRPRVEDVVASML